MQYFGKIKKKTSLSTEQFTTSFLIGCISNTMQQTVLSKFVSVLSKRRLRYFLYSGYQCYKELEEFSKLEMSSNRLYPPARYTTSHAPRKRGWLPKLSARFEPWPGGGRPPALLYEHRPFVLRFAFSRPSRKGNTGERGGRLIDVSRQQVPNL